MHRWDIINHLIEKNGYKRYLEIGYFKGWSFDSVNCEYKVAVDPNPSKDVDQEKMNYGSHFGNEKEWISKMTSDEFFEKFPPGEINPITEKKFLEDFDIIFIDGLHEAEQVGRDIENSLKHLSPGGTIVMHDCKPEIYEHTTTGDCGGNWLGDTYKAFMKFHFEHPEYNSYVVDTDWGCGIIETPCIDSTFPLIDGLFKGEDYRNFLEWDKFSENKAGLLNLITVEEFKIKVNERIKNNNLSAK